MPDQVGDRNKGATIIELDQKEYGDYGLPGVKELPDSAFAEPPKILPKARSSDLAYAQIVKAVLGEKNNFRSICTPLEPVVVSKKGLRYISEKIPDARERYANFILPTLTDPNEIWLTRYDDGSFRRRFIKLFRGKKNMLIIARENINGSLFWNAIPVQENYVDNQRTGTLLYENN